MLLSGLEIQPFFATLSVLLDNCSSLFDCWDTLGAAAAAAVGAGAAAVFVGGLLLSPGEGTGIVEEGVPPVATGTASSSPVTFAGGGVAGTVAQAPPPMQPQVQAPAPAPAPAHVQPQVQPPAPPQVQASPPQVAPVAQPAAPHVGAVQPGPVAASATAEQPAPLEPATPVETGPVAPSASPGAATPDHALDVSPAAPAPAPADAPAVFDTGLAAGLASGVAPVASALASVAGSRAGSSGTGRDSSGQDQDDRDEDEVTCPEADASLFGLPDINTRQDCPGTRPGMPPNYAGMDFTSNDDRGRPMELPFEAGVTGEVTYVGGAFNSVQVTLENGNRIQFLHASQVLVQVGQPVEPTTVLGRTGGTGPYGPNHYEIHLHVQAFDPHGDLIDPDCALSGGENRRLRRRVAPPEPAQSQSQPAPGATTVLPGTQPLPPVEVPQMPVQVPVPVQAPTPPPQVIPHVTPQVGPPVMPQLAPQAQTDLRCTRCGNVSPAGALFCPWCGQTLARTAVPTQAPIASPPTVRPPSAPPQVIYCGNCGQANDWGAAFCGRCGTKLAY